MLSGDILPSSGSASLAGFDIVRQQLQVRRLLGYCPQFDALLDLLSAREHLELYARIKGVPEADLRRVVERQLDEFDLREYAGKLAGTLSGGNKRKLSVAIALIGDPPVVFLDEPSTGVDPVARRFMWGVIARVASGDRGTTIVLTTHSMEEVEALCTRIGIMVGGRLRCLGTSQHLKSRHGSGFVTEVRLAPPPLLATDALVVAVRAQLAGAAGGGPAETVSAAALPALLARLGCPARLAELRPDGAGWQLAGALQAAGLVSVRELAAFLAEEDAVERLRVHLGAAFPGASLVERQGLVLRLAIPPGGNASLAVMFAKLEAARAPCGIATYTLSQTTLEMVFNTMAAQQEEEQGLARGVVLAPAAAAAAATGVSVAAAVARSSGAAVDWRLASARSK